MTHDYFMRKRNPPPQGEDFADAGSVGTPQRTPFETAGDVSSPALSGLGIGSLHVGSEATSRQLDQVSRSKVTNADAEKGDIRDYIMMHGVSDWHDDKDEFPVSGVRRKKLFESAIMREHSQLQWSIIEDMIINTT